VNEEIEEAPRVRDAGPDLDPSEESPRAPTGESFSDAVTFGFGDLESMTFGVARIGVSGDEHRGASGLALLFSGSEVAAVRLEGGSETSSVDWEELAAAGIRTTVDRPLSHWSVTFDGGQEGGFALDFEALGSAAVVNPAGAASRAGGMQGYEHLCRVSGMARIGEQEREIHCLGQRGHSWGSPDWAKMALARSLGAWLDEDLAVMLTAVRPSGASEHDAEAIEAVLLEGSEPLPDQVADARLSTVYDEQGRHRRAGLELWPREDSDFPRRAAGDLVCGTSLDLGRLRLDSAFFRWHMEDREGVGRYDIVRRVSSE
jgi:hypothetical protein